jgi:NDP-sugar pyrophosphorylase family protein
MQKIDKSNTTLMVVAAGLGTRMKPIDVPKALVEVNSKPIVFWTLMSFMDFCKDIVFVISPSRIPIFKKFEKNYKIRITSLTTQSTPNGTAYAIDLGLKNCSTDWVVVIWGDHIGASKFDFKNVINSDYALNFDFILPVVYRQNPYVYFKSLDNLEFHETKLGAEKIQSGISDCGVFIFKRLVIKEVLGKFLQDLENPTNEVNFLSLFNYFSKIGIRFKMLLLQDYLLTFGINTIEDIRIWEKNSNES